jgi:Fe-S cluster biogenesis protein NfuA
MSMTTTLDANEFRTKLERLDGLLREVDQFTDPTARAHMRNTVQAVLNLHGAGLERLLEHVAEAGEPGQRILDACTRDGVVGGLLLLHGLHPLSLEERVGQALEDVRPYLRSHGGNVQLLDVSDAVVRLRLQGSCHHCPSSSITMQQTVEEAILARAPEVVTVEVEGLPETPPEPENGRARVALPVL